MVISNAEQRAGRPMVRKKSGKSEISSRSGKNHGIFKMVREKLENPKYQEEVRKFSNFMVRNSHGIFDEL